MSTARIGRIPYKCFAAFRFLVFIVLFAVISIGIIDFIGISWILPIPAASGLVIGIILQAVGLSILVSAFRTLSLHRALGGDVYKTSEGSKLITTGVYSRTRNPLYFSTTLILFGWTMAFTSSFLLVFTLQFLLIFWLASRREEMELEDRFGEQYLRYKEEVPRFFPSLRFQRKHQL